jgi:hypothetical protein
MTVGGEPVPNRFRTRSKHTGDRNSRKVSYPDKPSGHQLFSNSAAGNTLQRSRRTARNSLDSA